MLTGRLGIATQRTIVNHGEGIPRQNPRSHVDAGNPLEAYVEHILSACQKAPYAMKKLRDHDSRQLMRPEVTDLNEVVRSASKLLPLFSDNGIRLQMGFANRELPVMIDGSRFQDILISLISNALHAMPHGGKLFITAEPLQFGFNNGATNGDDGRAFCAVLRVVDTGTGMASEVKERMFRPCSTAKEMGIGVGLGLPSVYQIIKEHRGSINVKSAIGEGTEVDIYLPLVERT